MQAIWLTQANELPSPKSAVLLEMDCFAHESVAFGFCFESTFLADPVRDPASDLPAALFSGMGRYQTSDALRQDEDKKHQTARE